MDNNLPVASKLLCTCLAPLLTLLTKCRFSGGKTLPIRTAVKALINGTLNILGALTIRSSLTYS